MVEINLEEWEPIIHVGWNEDRLQFAVNKRPCERTAFYIKKNVKLTDRIKNEDFISADGQPMDIMAATIDFIPCPQCGNPVRNSDIVRTIERLLGIKYGSE